MIKVEFRLLQFIISHLTGDRVSVVLLHWDGRELRVASSLEHLLVCGTAQRDVVRASVKVIVRRAKKIAQSVVASPRLNHGLKELFPVREGRGSALYWAPVTIAETANAAAHFEQLSKTLKLDRDRIHSRRFTAHTLRRQLKAMGEELKALAPQRVKTERAVRVKKQFRSPLSWKNGRWHHALPFSLDGLDVDQVDHEVERLVGLIELAVPRADVPVLVALVPEDPATARRTRTEARIVRQVLAERHCEVLTAPLQGSEVKLSSVRRRVKRDVIPERNSSLSKKSTRDRARVPRD